MTTTKPGTTERVNWGKRTFEDIIDAVRAGHPTAQKAAKRRIAAALGQKWRVEMEEQLARALADRPAITEGNKRTP